MHRWLGNWRLWIGVVVLLAMAVALVTSTRERREAMVMERLVLDALAPVTQGAHSVAESLRETVDRLVRLSRLYEENEELRRQLAEYQRRDRDNADTVVAYDRLRRLLRLRERTSDTVTAASVIGRNPDQWLKMAIIDVGARDGVAENMVVVEPRGVVGRIIRVSERTSTVLLLTDPQSGIGVMTVGSRDAGVASGQAGSMELETRFFGGTPAVKDGDRVVTSGYGGIFPPGITVGEIVGIKHDGQGLVLTAQVQPTVDFDRLTEVLVVKPQQLPADFAPGGRF